ncbi:unnamed protein product [Camellia sinensis]
MEEIRETAQVYYKVVFENVRSLAKEFFKKMDDNRDGKVSLAKFAGFMAEAGYPAMNNPSFFEEINKNKNGELDFDDVKTLYYILQNGRPLCGCCRKFIVRMYFTCVKCFRCETQSFCLHRACFGRGQYVHKHSDFVDMLCLNPSDATDCLVEMLRRMRSLKPDKSKPSTSTSLEIVQTPLKPSKSKPSTSTSLEIVPTFVEAKQIQAKYFHIVRNYSDIVEAQQIQARYFHIVGNCSDIVEAQQIQAKYFNIVRNCPDISLKPSKSKPSTSTLLEIVPTSLKPKKSKPSTSTSLEIVLTSLKPSKSKLSISTSFEIVPTLLKPSKSKPSTPTSSAIVSI